jgi:hypothetical protein
LTVFKYLLEIIVGSGEKINMKITNFFKNSAKKESSLNTNNGNGMFKLDNWLHRGTLVEKKANLDFMK